jgi:pyruvate dehydrogenase E2 component (dihydrolipoamide acetyltransferase)
MWTDEAILLFDEVDISIAVATDAGLITPVIRNADQKGLSTLSNEMKDLAKKARDGKLKPEEFQGGGFTISNLGMFGIREFSAIINPPQSCILAVGAGEQRVVVRDGAAAVRTMMSCTLSVDHRSVDGAVGAQFLAALKPLIEDPLQLML